nr:hypothetical protein Iba_chr06aCG3910 [Ipomoea batatas]
MEFEVGAARGYMFDEVHTPSWFNARFSFFSTCVHLNQNLQRFSSNVSNHTVELICYLLIINALHHGKIWNSS